MRRDRDRGSRDNTERHMHADGAQKSWKDEGELGEEKEVEGKAGRGRGGKGREEQGLPPAS